jgi:zinc and cadmium transporter
MDTALLYTILFSLLGGVLSLVGGLILTLGDAKSVKKFSKLAIPFAAGSLLAAVFLDLLKEGIEQSSADTVLLFALIGVITFFLIERLTHWFHHHHEEDTKNNTKSPLLIVVADTLHNAMDGIAIGAAFLTSIPTGIVTSLAVAAHEIPQEVGDFGVLLSRGLSRRRVILLNIISSLATTLMAFVTFTIGDTGSLPVGALLGLSAGFLLYVAASDLIPTIHQKKSVRGKLDVDVVLLLVGVAVVATAIQLSHRYIDAGHDHHDEVCTSYLDKSGKEELHLDCTIEDHGH